MSDTTPWMMMFLAVSTGFCGGICCEAGSHYCAEGMRGVRDIAARFNHGRHHARK
jgi:hypothetical protein